MSSNECGRSVRAIAAAARAFDRALDDLDLTLGQYRLLAFLAEGDWAASRLADHLAVSRPSVTAMVDSLVGRRLVERRPGVEDRRRVLHVITQRGRSALARADAVLGEEIERLVSFDPEPQVALEGLDRFAEAVAAAFEARRRQAVAP